MNDAFMYGVCALTLAILAPRQLLPEEAFRSVDAGKIVKRAPAETGQYISMLRESGMTWGAIGNITGYDPSSACRVLKKWRMEHGYEQL